MCSEHFNATFSVTAVDGVSCDSEYMKNKLRGFLGGKQESAQTDVNHNSKNVR